VRRRSLLLASGSATLDTLVGASAALAQTASESRRIGMLTVADKASFAGQLQAFRDGLRERGHVEGRDIVIDIRYADARQPGLARLAAELAAQKPSVIVGFGPAATQAAHAATADVPIVALLRDFVAAGMATELGRPAGRVTGVSFFGATLNAKRLELLAELLPKGSVVLNLAEPNSPDLPSVEAAGRALGVTMHAAYAATPQQIDATFATARGLRVAGINQLASPFLHAHRLRIIELAAMARLPVMYQWPDSARDGGLMAYGPSLTAIDVQLANYVSRILGGARPGDLPIEQPSRFEFVINLKAAKAIGVTIPQTLLLRADEVIQ
jgi:putative tryptophan/tyrosine transport system substrate-binding protein